MLGNPKKPDPPIMVSAEEVCRLETKFGTVQEIEFCVEVLRHWQENYSDWHDEDPRYGMMVRTAALFTAGRLQGIREERARRRGIA